MSDLSEQQVMMADAAAGGKAERDEQYQKKIRESVDSLLGAVSEADRILLMLKEVEGLSLKELEKIYKVNENALKVRLFRARQRVLKAFGAAGRGKEPAAAGEQVDMDLMRGSEEERLDALFRAFRECPAPEPSANFMPNLWARIDSRQSFTFSFRRLANAFVTAAVAAFHRLGRVSGASRFEPVLLLPDLR